MKLNPNGKSISLKTASFNNQYFFNVLDLLDEEIDTIRALIGTYDAKIALLEEKLANKGTTVNKKGKRVRAEQMTFIDGTE